MKELRQRALASCLVLAVASAGLFTLGLRPGVADTPRRDVVVATGGDTNSLDPFKTGSIGGTLYVDALFDTLVTLNPTPNDGRGRWAPDLATSWTVAPDGKSIEFVLRPGVKFQNGATLTADDVKFSLEMAVDPATKNPDKTYIYNIKNVDVLAPDRVRVNLTEPWLGTLDGIAHRGQIVPKDYFNSVGEAGFAKAPVGSGPYSFVSMVQGDRLKMKAFDQYWAGAPPFASLTLQVVPDINSQVELLATGEADVALSVQPSQIDTVKGNGDNVSLLRGGYQRFIFIQTLKGGPLADSRVRMALNLAIDRKTAFNAVFGGDVPLLNGPLSEYQLGGKAAGPYPYDPDQAKKLLTAAGYPNGFSTELDYPPGHFVGDDELIPILVSYWKKIGVNVTTKPVDYNQWLQLIFQKSFPGLLSHAKGVGVVSDPISAFSRHEVCDGIQSSYCNPKIDALVKSAAGITDEKKMTEIFSQAQIIAHDDAAQVFLYDEPSIMATSKKVKWTAESGPESGLLWFNLKAVN